LFENEITDISPLQNLVNLKELYIFNNKILDITVLQYLENLENLSIYNNQIVDVRPVLGLKKIRQMDLWSNPIYYLLPENLRNAGWSSIKKYFLQYKDNWAALRKKILFTMAQPTDVVVLKTPKEFARIQAAIQKSNLLDIEYFYSMGVNLLTEKITINQYNIFHFAGHGNKDTIFLEAADGTHAPISWRNLAGTLAKSTSKFDLVFLNSDYSVGFANITTKNIRYKILIKETLGEDSAILFSQNFYNALGERYDIERAFVKARKILILHTYAEAHKIPIELITEHENAYNIHFI
jgi:hypothetical protein